MAKPLRYTAAAIQLGEIDLIAREVRKANRAPGRTEWYREVLIERRGARHVATGRPVAGDGSVGERTEFSEGPQHQTYEVRDVADLDGPLTRAAVHDMRAACREIIARHTRLDITAEQVERMFYAELIETLDMLRADAEAEAYDDAPVAEVVAPAAPAAAVTSWRTVRAGHYLAVGLGDKATGGEVRRDPQATPANRWVARVNGERISAHRLLMSAKGAVVRALNGRSATDRARAAVEQHAADLGVSTAAADRDLRRRAADLDPQYAAMLRAGLPESYLIGDRELTMPQAIGVVVDLLVEGCPITRLGDAWAARRGDDHLTITPAVIDAATFAGVVTAYTGGADYGVDPDRIELVTLATGTVVTVTPLGDRQFEVIDDDGIDGMVRVAPRRVRCEHDHPKWVGRTYVRPVPAGQVEQVPGPEDDDPEYNDTCLGHEPRPATDDDELPVVSGPIDKAAITAKRIGSLMNSGATDAPLALVAAPDGELREAAADLLAQCWHGTWVTLRAMPRGWWHLGSDTLCDDQGPHVPEDVDRDAVYAAAAAARSTVIVPDVAEVTMVPPGGRPVSFRPGMLVTITVPDGPAWRIDRLLQRGGVTPAPYATLRDPADPAITCGAFVGDLRPLPADRVAHVEAGHDISLVLARKLDGRNLVQAVCSCGGYTSAPGAPKSAAEAGTAHRLAKTGPDALAVAAVAAELFDLAGHPLNRAGVMVSPALLRNLAAALRGKLPIEQAIPQAAAEEPDAPVGKWPAPIDARPGDVWRDEALGVTWHAREDTHGAVELFEPNGPGRIPAGELPKMRAGMRLVRRDGVPVLRDPYVGEGADGARRSADMDRAEADTFDTGSVGWIRCRDSAARWDAQAAYLDSQATKGTQLT